jgi:uncharacterized protein
MLTPLTADGRLVTLTVLTMDFYKRDHERRTPVSDSKKRLQDYGPWGFVTGATEGIGRAIAAELGRAGFNLVLVARRQPELDAVANSLTDQFGVETLCLTEDLTDPTAIERIADRTGHLDVGLAVLAAGFGSVGEFVRSDLSTELDMIAVNVSAVMALAHLFARRLVARGRGGMVLFSSIVGWQGTPLQANYAATKAYVQVFAEGLHAELADGGVDVLAVAPGPVHTGFAVRAGMTMSTAAQPESVAQQALGALGRRTTLIPDVGTKVRTYALWSLPRAARSAIMRSVINSMRSETQPTR